MCIHELFSAAYDSISLDSYFERLKGRFPRAIQPDDVVELCKGQVKINQGFEVIYFYMFTFHESISLSYVL